MRVLTGPFLTAQVLSKNGAPLAGVTVTPSAAMFSDRELTASVSTLTTNGNGVFTAYAAPGVYTFTVNTTDAAPIESVEVLSPDQGIQSSSGGSGLSQSAADARYAPVTGSAAYAPQLRLIFADLLTGVDPTGATDSTAAIAAAQTAQGTNPYLIILGTGTYRIGTTTDLLTFGRKQGIIGAGAGLTFISYYGSGTCINVYDSSFSNAASVAGRFGGYTLDGVHAGAAAVGFQFGNLLRGRASDMTVQNFAGIGIYGKNGSSSSWSEQWQMEAKLIQNGTANVVFDTFSFDYGTFRFHINAAGNQHGVCLQNTARLVGCELSVIGNFNGAASSNTGAVIALDPTGAGTGSSQIRGRVFVGVEANGTGVGHYPIYMAGGSASEFWGQGTLDFLDADINFQSAFIRNWQAGGPNFGWSGIVNAHGIGTMTAGDAFMVEGGSQSNVHGNLTTALSSNTIYLQFADTQAFRLASGAQTLVFTGVPDVRTRKIDLFVAQPASGAAGTVTWPGNVVWPGGSTAPALSTANGAVDRFRLIYEPTSAVWYASIVSASPGTSDLAMGSHKITGLANGVSATDAATVGQVTSANATPSPDQLRRTAWGVQSEPYPVAVASNTSLMTSGRMEGALVGLQAGTVLNGVVVACSANSASLTGLYVALYDSAGNLLASSANQSTALNAGAGTLVAVPFSATYTVPTNGGYYASILPVGTTPPTLYRAASTGTDGGVNGGVPLFAFSTGNSVLPSPVVYAKESTSYWVGVY